MTHEGAPGRAIRAEARGDGSAPRRPARRCAWCHRADGELVESVLPAGADSATPGRRTVALHPEHRDPFFRHVAQVERWRWWFLAALFALQVVLLAGVLLAGAGRPAGSRVMSAALAGFGVLLVVLPLATPQTAWLVGVRRARRLARLAGALLGLAGAAAFAVQG